MWRNTMMQDIYARLRAAHEFLRDRSGAIAVMVGLAMPIFIGGMGLGGEISYWYFTQRKLQNGADVAAYSGATMLRETSDKDEIDAAALAAAVTTGYRTSIGEFELYTPASSGAFAGVPNTVEVKLKENVPRMFSGVFQAGDVPINGRAVARMDDIGGACVLALDPSAAAAAEFTGTSDTVLTNCNVHANSTAADALKVAGTASVVTPCVSAVGEIEYTAGLTMTGCINPVAHADPIDDPFALLPEPSTAAPCEPVNSFGGSPGTIHNIGPGHYCGGLSMRRIVHMAPGVYVVDGGQFAINSSAVVDGYGVTIFLTGDATIQINGGADVTLHAPTSGTYQGILFFVDRDNAFADHHINGHSGSDFQGATYAANGRIIYNGTSDINADACTQIVARMVRIAGTNGLGTDCTGMGLNPIGGEKIVYLVE